MPKICIFVPKCPHFRFHTSPSAIVVAVEQKNCSHICLQSKWRFFYSIIFLFLPRREGGPITSQAQSTHLILQRLTFLRGHLEMKDNNSIKVQRFNYCLLISPKQESEWMLLLTSLFQCDHVLGDAWLKSIFDCDRTFLWFNQCMSINHTS